MASETLLEGDEKNMMLNRQKLRKLIKDWNRGKYRRAVTRICIGAACLCAVLLGSYYMQGRKAEENIDLLRDKKINAMNASGTEGEALVMADRKVLGSYKDLFLQNPDLIGWLTVDGTKIDYPVMWTPEDPEYYSQRGFDKEESRNGLLFLDQDSNINENGGNLIIYGHNMKNGSMFADLLKYQKQSYWEKHKMIQLDTLYESRTYEIAAVAITNDLEQLPYGFTRSSETEGTDAIERMKDNALYDTGVDMEYGDDFLTLSTCDYSEEDGRLVVMARRVLKK